MFIITLNGTVEGAQDWANLYSTRFLWSVYRQDYTFDYINWYRPPRAWYDTQFLPNCRISTSDFILTENSNSVSQLQNKACAIVTRNIFVYSILLYHGYQFPSLPVWDVKPRPLRLRVLTLHPVYDGIHCYRAVTSQYVIHLLLNNHI